jgi:23S rRNA (uracil1939-C5)-methyltransferase
MSEATVTIEKMVYGGAGLGRVEGKACFVPLTAPGDQARIRVVKEKRSYIEGVLLELAEPSPLRVEPLCPFFGSCGGCNWQHLPYQEQLNQKAEIFAGTLSRIGRVESDNILPVAASGNRYGYRSRIQLKLALRKGRAVLGFFRTGSHEVIEIQNGCAIADPLLNLMTEQLRAVLDRLPELDGIPQIDLSVGDDGCGLAVIHFHGKNVEKLAARLKEFRNALRSIGGVLVRSGAKGAPRQVYGIDSLSYAIAAEVFGGSRDLRLRFSKGGFSQVNYRQNLELVRTVCEWGAFRGTERVLDLFCGNGNISLPVAARVARVFGVEGFAPSIEDAVHNAAANGVGNASFETCDALAAVRRLVKGGERFDVVILDPPRGGAEGAGEIAQLRPEKIIYISCDPATLARDLALISEQGYEVTRSRPVDMFPQTYHLESVTELVRKSKAGNTNRT